MRGATWPAAAKIREWALSIVAHSRGATGSGGHYEFERGPGAMWAGSLAVPPMCADDAAEFRAFLHGLRGRSGTFEIDLPGRSLSGPCTNRDGSKTRYTDCTEYSDGTSYTDSIVLSATGTLTADAAAYADTLALSSASLLQVGDWLTVGGQLFRIVDIDGNDVGVRPRVRSDMASGTAWQAASVTATFRLATDAPVMAFVPGRSTETQIEIEEAY